MTGVHQSVSGDQLKQRLEQIEGYAKALAAAVHVMDERRHILEPLLRDDGVRGALAAKFENTFGAHAYNHLVPLLGQDLVRDLARLFLDDGKKAGSLLNIYRKASEGAVHRALREKFRSIPDRWYEDPAPIDGISEEQSALIREQSRDRHREDFQKAFEEGWASVTKAVETIKVDPVAQKIKTFRDKYHAHLEMNRLGKDPGPFDVGSLGLTYNDLLDFADRYMGAVFELSRIVTGNVADVEDFSAVHRQYGADMWRVLAGLQTCEA